MVIYKTVEIFEVFHTPINLPIDGIRWYSVSLAGGHPSIKHVTWVEEYITSGTAVCEQSGYDRLSEQRSSSRVNTDSVCRLSELIGTASSGL